MSQTPDFSYIGVCVCWPLINNVYIASEINRLLSSLTQALQNAGIDLSHAKLSVQIDLGNRANPSNKVLNFGKCFMFSVREELYIS